MSCHLVVLAQASAMLVGNSKLIGSLLCLIIIYLADAAFQFVFVFREAERKIGTLFCAQLQAFFVIKIGFVFRNMARQVF